MSVLGFITMNIKKKKIIMIRPIRTTALAAVITLALTACGGGSGGSNTASGVGGSGYISSGTVTGFGSVFVNGVEFNTDNSTFDLEGTSGTQNDLAIGMVVRVNGTINGTTGNATSIIFDDELQGPVSGLTPTISPTTTSATFTVLGTTVKINRSSTSFDGTTFSFDTIADQDNIEISGFFNASGTLLASRVELKDDVFEYNKSIVEIKGDIAGLTGSTFTLNGLPSLTIELDPNVNLDDLPNGLVNGIRVEVKGTFDGTGTITATKVASKEIHVDDSEEFELEGYITDFDSASGNFKINGIPVNTSSATFSPSGITLANDLQVEAEGSIVNGVLKAQKLKLRGGDVKVYATVSAINPDLKKNIFYVSPVLTQPAITIGLGTETEMKNEVPGNEAESLNITHLTVGDFVQIEGFENNGSVFASQVKIVSGSTSKIKVQGNITETDNDGVITVLGVTFDIASSTFEDSNNHPIATEALFNAAAASNPLILVTANSDAGTADKVELEER